MLTEWRGRCMKAYARFCMRKYKKNIDRLIKAEVSKQLPGYVACFVSYQEYWERNGGGRQPFHAWSVSILVTVEFGGTELDKAIDRYRMLRNSLEKVIDLNIPYGHLFLNLRFIGYRTKENQECQSLGQCSVTSAKK